MKLALLSAALSTVLLSGVCAHAQEAGVFDKWLNERSPTCVSVSEFKTLSTVIELTPEQFQFRARALCRAAAGVANLATWRQGRHGELRRGRHVRIGGRRTGLRAFSRAGLHHGDVIQVGMGETGHIGTPAAYHLFVERPDGS